MEVSEPARTNLFFAAGLYTALTAAFLTGCPRDSSDKMKADGGPLGPSGTIATIAGTGAKATDPVDANADGAVDNPIAANQANLDQPVDIAMGPASRLYILDWNGHKVRALGPDGKVAFVTGTGFEGDGCRDFNLREAAHPDGTCPALYAEFNHMTDVTFDSAGRMVIAAWHNSKIKRVDFSRGVMEDICGTGNRRFEGDGGPCKDAKGRDLVSFDLLSSVVFDQAGHLFISDQANQVIRRISTDGFIKTIAGHCPPDSEPGGVAFGCEAGQGDEGNDGPAISAKLHNQLGQGTDPQGKIAMDTAGHLYIADTGNNVVRKVVPGADGSIGNGDPNQEVITTMAGTGVAGYSGDGGPATQAQLSEPRDVEVAADGSLYIADTENNCVRKVDPSGVITTVAGRCGKPGGFAGDGGPPHLAVLNKPYGIELDAAGNLYIADTFNNRIRVVYR